MKIRIGTLRRILREVALSPAVFKNNEPTRDPMDRPTIAKAVQDLENAFRRGVEMNAALAHRDAYNEETREFDDQVYEQIKGQVDNATEMLTSAVNKALRSAWTQASQGAKAEEPAVSGVRPSAPKKAVA